MSDVPPLPAKVEEAVEDVDRTVLGASAQHALGLWVAGVNQQGQNHSERRVEQGREQEVHHCAKRQASVHFSVQTSSSYRNIKSNKIP
jgi:hypothetical protein